MSSDAKSHECRKLYNQAGLYRAQENTEKAEALYLSSIAQGEREFGKKHPQVAQSLYGLAVLYDLHDDKRAEETYRRAHTACSNAAEFLKNPGVYLELAQVACLRTLSSLLEQAKELQAAEWFVVKVGSIIENLLGPKAPELSKTMFHLATIYDKQDKPKESTDAHQHAIDIKSGDAGREKTQFNKRVFQKTQAIRALAQRINRDDLATAIWLNHLATVFANSDSRLTELHLSTLADIKEALEQQKKQK